MWWEQTTAAIIGSRCGCGLLPLGVPEWAPFVSSITSEEDITIEHYWLLLSLPWGLTHTAATIAILLDTLSLCLGSLPLPRVLQLGVPSGTFLQVFAAIKSPATPDTGY